LYKILNAVETIKEGFGQALFQLAIQWQKIIK